MTPNKVSPAKAPAKASARSKSAPKSIPKAPKPVVFVGAGPGSPDLITVAGRQAIEEADVIVVAGSLVNPEIMSPRRPDCLVVDSASLALNDITDTLIENAKKGRRVVRLHTGDPSLYGAINEQMAILNQAGIPFRVIPGVTAATAAAASLGLEFTLPELTQTLIITRTAGRTPMPEGEDLASLVSHRSSLALYLSAAQGNEVSRVLSSAYGPDSPVAVCVRVGWPDGRTIWTTAGGLEKTLKAEKIDRHALILAGPAVEALKTGTKAAESKLYDASFSHAHRQAAKKPSGSEKSS
jgi:precorrin-4/cobalt-precorrin-4 C11-methyltransferase